MTNLHQQLRTTLLNCGPFRSDSQLQALFVDSRLRPWKNEVPSAPNPLERVEAIIALLSDRRNDRGERALGLFIQVLAERTHPGDACHHRLHELAEVLAQARSDAGEGGMHTVKEPGAKSASPQIIVQGDYYGGDRVENVSGDHIEGDISVERISGSAVSVGHQAQSSVRRGEQPKGSAALFSLVYRQIEARPPNPDVEREEIVELVKKIESEVMNPNPNPRKVARWLNNLEEIALAIHKQIVTLLSGSQEAVPSSIRDVARQAKAGGDG